MIGLLNKRETLEGALQRDSKDLSELNAKQLVAELFFDLHLCEDILRVVDFALDEIKFQTWRLDKDIGDLNSLHMFLDMLNDDLSTNARPELIKRVEKYQETVSYITQILGIEVATVQ